MDELISQVCDKIGVDKAVASKAIGSILEFLKDNVGKDFDFSSLLNSMPGAETLLKEADEPLSSGEQPRENSEVAGGIIGLIKWVLSIGPVWDMLKYLLTLVFGEQATKMLESTGEGVELAGMLNKLGLSKEQGTTMVTMLINFMRDKVDPNLVDQLIDQIPLLKSMMGSKED